MGTSTKPKEKKVENKQVVKICPYCKTEFVKVRQVQVYCRDQCRLQHYFYFDRPARTSELNMETDRIYRRGMAEGSYEQSYKKLEGD